jgi:hypothetical protein
MTTIGVVMAGWASNSKWALFGAMREAAQVIAYEIPLGISLLVPLMVVGTFHLGEASAQQASWFGMHWVIFQNPFVLPAFILFFVAALAETKRAPFDLPESESELVAGFMTEYSGIRWSFFFLEEYAAMFLMSIVGGGLLPRRLREPAHARRARAVRQLERRLQRRRGPHADGEGDVRRVPDDVAALDAAARAHRSGDEHGIQVPHAARAPVRARRGTLGVDLLRRTPDLVCTAP